MQLFLCLFEKAGSGRTGPYNVQITVVNNNCYESRTCVCARMVVCVSGRVRRACGSAHQFSEVMNEGMKSGFGCAKVYCKL